MKGAVKHERANRVFSAPTVAWRSPGRPGAQAEACGLPPRPRSTKTTATNAGSVSAARPFFSPTPPRRAQEPSARPPPAPCPRPLRLPRRWGERRDCLPYRGSVPRRRSYSGQAAHDRSLAVSSQNGPRAPPPPRRRSSPRPAPGGVPIGWDFSRSRS